MQWLGIVVLCAAACSTPGAADADAGRFVIDERAPLPQADPAYIDLVTPEEIIEPGQEKIFCLSLVNHGGELAIDLMVPLQGSGGHHMSMMIATDPKPEGTIEDCTSPESNAGLSWFVLTTTPLPTGTAMAVPDGMPFVLQFHYINANDDPMLVRDIARLHVVDPATVVTWAATMVATDVSFEVTPGKSSVTWTCTLDQDRDLLVLFGHMHAFGTRYSVEIGPTFDTLATMQVVEPWLSSFRDSPPTESYYDAPVHLAAGTIFRTTCEWTNPYDLTLTYPTEMCFTFAYLANAKTPAHCVPSTRFGHVTVRG